MTEIAANLDDNENEALSHAASVVTNLDLTDVLNPKRLVQVVHPNQIHNADTMYLVISPQDTEMLYSKRESVRFEAMQKVAKLEAQLDAIRNSHNFLTVTENEE